MMTITFAVLLAAFVLRLWNLPRAAMVSLFLSFALVVGIFLWEIYSPDYGFRMPWLQVDLRHTATAGST